MSSRKKGLLYQLKRGSTSLFVCAVVLLPLFSVGWWFKYLFIHNDPRRATALPQFVHRSIDTNTPPKLFQEPLISVTFDDGWESVYTMAMPLLQKYGIRNTQYLISSTTDDIHYLSKDQIKQLINNGYEIGCHTVSHADLVSLSDKELWDELNGCKTAFEKDYHITTTNFASPYGRYNSHTLSVIRQLYSSQRNTDGDITDGVNGLDVNVKSSFDRYNIIGVTLERDTPLWQIKAAVDYTIKHNGWLVLNYHQIDSGSSEYGLQPKNLEKQLSYVSKSPVRIVTMDEVIRTLK